MYLTIDFDFSFVLSNLGYPISASIHTVNNKMDPCLKCVSGLGNYDDLVVDRRRRRVAPWLLLSGEYSKCDRSPSDPSSETSVLRTWQSLCIYGLYVFVNERSESSYGVLHVWLERPSFWGGSSGSGQWGLLPGWWDQFSVPYRERHTLTASAHPAMIITYCRPPPDRSASRKPRCCRQHYIHCSLGRFRKRCPHCRR